MPNSRSLGESTHPIAIVGAGALGSVFASALLQAGQDVTLLGRSAAPDITVCVPPCDVKGRPLRVETDPATLANAEFVLLLVKTYDTEMAVRNIGQHLRPHATVVTLQNGLGNVERIRASLGGSQRILPGVTSQAARRVSRGLVMHTGTGPTVIGYEDDVERELAACLADKLTLASLPATTTRDIDYFIWRKVAINAAINGLTAVSRIPNGELLSSPRLFEAAQVLLEEASSVATTYGYDLAGIHHSLRDTIIATAHNRSSMLQDVEAGRRTEVDAIYGSLIAAGQERGLALPALTVVDALVRAVSGADEDKEVPE